MKKSIVALAILMGGMSTAQAEICYRLDPFGDVLRLTCQTNPSSGPMGSRHTVCYGNWIFTEYTLPVVGAQELNLGSTTVRRLGLHGTNNTTSFAGNPNCVLDGIPSNPWTLNCVGGASIFTNSGSPLTPISCSGVAPSMAMGGPAAGD
jgi:hypothetical protein